MKIDPSVPGIQPGSHIPPDLLETNGNHVVVLTDEMAHFQNNRRIVSIFLNNP
jgi:hypothetical protein